MFYIQDRNIPFSDNAARILYILCALHVFILSPVQAEVTMPNNTKLDRPEILQVMFHPRQAAKSDPPPQAVNIDIRVEQYISIGCRLFTADKEAPIIIFFHGNGEIVPDYDDIGPVYISHGLNFLIADFRGYGWSSGRPSAVSLISDARTVFSKAVEWLNANGYTGKIFVMGRSLGSACAIDLALEFQKNISGLIIESGFAETLPLMQTLGVDLAAFGITEKDCFDNLDKISRILIPTLILHGRQDTLIPPWHAEKLHAAGGARSKELQIIPGADHNTVIAVAGILYFQAIKGFINKVTGADSWRERRKRYKRQQKP